MSMYGKYPKNADGSEKKAWPSSDFSKDKGFTVQADREDADINKIINRFLKSGQLPPQRGGQPFYGDVSDIGDLQDSLMKIKEAESLFMQYPAQVRERFENDYVKMVDFLEDPKNLDEAVELGLVVKREQGVPNPVVPPTNVAEANIPAR